MENKKINIKLDIYMFDQLIKTKVSIKENEKIEDFLIALQMFLKDFEYNVEKISVFEVLTNEFERIGIVGDDGELFIEENFKEIETVSDINKTSLSIVSLKGNSIEKILQEEELLKEALANYDVENALIKEE